MRAQEQRQLGTRRAPYAHHRKATLLDLGAAAGQLTQHT